MLGERSPNAEINGTASHTAPRFCIKSNTVSVMLVAPMISKISLSVCTLGAQNGLQRVWRKKLAQPLPSHRVPALDRNVTTFVVQLKLGSGVYINKYVCMYIHIYIYTRVHAHYNACLHSLGLTAQCLEQVATLKLGSSSPSRIRRWSYLRSTTVAERHAPAETQEENRLHCTYRPSFVSLLAKLT